MSDLRQRIANLSPEKLALLELRLEQRVAARANFKAISRRTTPGPYPLSFAQQRLWFLEQLEPDTPHYNEAKAVRMRGALDVDALQHALDALVARHEVLRTAFVVEDGQPMQVIAQSGTVELPMIDLRAWPKSEQEMEAQRLLAETVQRPFDLSRDLMLRTLLLRLAPADHVLLLVTHHIASDGWSVGILWRDLSALYAAFAAGRSSPLPELPIQYTDYALWQRQWLQGEVLDTQLAYWKRQLEGAPTVLELPTDRPRPPLQTYRGARQSVLLPTSLSEALKTLSRQEGVTLFMTLLAAFQTLLHRYTGQDDIVIGAPIAGRNRPELEELIGFFVNTLVLRTDLGGNPPFRELLHRVQEVALGAYAHQELPFERLVEELQPARSLSRSPVFQVMLALQNVPRVALELPGLTLSPLEVDSGTAKFDLFLAMVEEGNRLRAQLEHSTDLFDAATIVRMLGHFQTLLEGIVADPEQRLSDLPLLTAPEREQLLVAWNATQSEYPREAWIHALFEAQVERTPDAVAVVFEDAHLTYRELNQRANQLAHYLRALGVGPEALVGICVERSLEMVSGLLGILKAGGAYVPLDPAYPRERLAYMLEDAQVSVVLTQQRLVTGLPAHAAQVICLDTDWQAIARESVANPGVSPMPENLAYVIYTSGSTGQPKGVQITHRALANFFHAMRQQLGLTAQDILLAVTTLSFDIAALELFLPLMAGARLVVVRGEIAADGPQLAKRLADSGATVMQATPATWRLLLEAGWEGSRSLHILCGGEALPRELANQLRTRGASLWNLYGPTETTIWSAAGKVASEEGPVPIGPPIANTQLYVLDAHVQPVPIGVPGELYIAGDGLARGYRNRPELTREKFISHPFSEEPGARLYKTGDLARYRPDGTIEFLGRLDHQVKLRGFRIELGEIEAALGQHPAVQEAVVVARQDMAGDTRLVAYVVSNQEQAPTLRELRDFVRAKLPEYMVPSAVVLLDVLPLTPNGKVNRRALPPLDGARPELAGAFVAPRTPVEEALTEIWTEVLRLERVGVHDNFFDIGGHSLLSTQLVSRVREALRVEVSVLSLFEQPTVADMARSIETTSQAGQAVPWYTLVPVQPGGSKPPFFSVYGWPLARHLGPEQPMYMLTENPDGTPARHDRLEDRAARYLAHIRTVQPEGPYFLGGYSFGGLVAFEMAQQLHQQGQEVVLLALFDTHSPPDPRFLPGTTALRDRVARQWERLLLLGPQAKLAYVLARAKEWVTSEMARIKRGTQKRVCEWYVGSGRPVPGALRQFYLQELHQQAARAYVPHVYPGRVTLFRTARPSDDPHGGWRRLAGGGLEIYTIPGTHLTIVTEPHVQVLAGHLRVCLAKAQATASGAQPESCSAFS